MTAKEIERQIIALTAKLIGLGFVNEQNYPSVRSFVGSVTEVGLRPGLDLSVSLRNISYSDIYEKLSVDGAFNFRMLDGALVQMFYKFERDEVVSHRLAYFPSPSLDAYQNEPELYEEDQIYADILARNVVAFPMRFDFDSSDDLFEAVRHPKSHMTLGQYKNCRIPVSAPVTPVVFVNFILRNFYATAMREFGDLGIPHTAFLENIHKQETSIPHLRLC